MLEQAIDVPDSRSTIFIQIAAYREPDLSATLADLIHQAAHPERLHIGICLQLEDSDPVAWGETSFPRHPHLSIIRYGAADSQGACWARHQAQQLFRGEAFLLQIDSHMRAVPNWDVLLLQTWAECRDRWAVLSVYPNGFRLPRQLQLDSLPVMGAQRFDDYGILKFQGISRYRLPDQQPHQPILNAFVAGGFLFGPGEIVSRVPYDPKLYFYGEEISMSVRLWTHGFNIYCPHQLLVFHLYKSLAADGDRSTTHWADHSDWFLLNRRSLVRVHTLLGSIDQAPASLNPSTEDIDDLNLYGLGSRRSLEAFQDWAGVNFTRQTISEEAIAGQFNSFEP